MDTADEVNPRLQSGPTCVGLTRVNCVHCNHLNFNTYQVSQLARAHVILCKVIFTGNVNRAPVTSTVNDLIIVAATLIMPWERSLDCFLISIPVSQANLATN